MRCVDNEVDWGKYILTDEFGEDFLIESPAKIGDVIWVRETFGIAGHTTKYYVYKADTESDWDKPKDGWKPSIFMPKDACRLFLEITDVRVEELHLNLSTSPRMTPNACYGTFFFQNVKFTVSVVIVSFLSFSLFATISE